MKKQYVVSAVLLALLFAGCAKAQTAWITDLDDAQAAAAKSKKDLLVVFTGSDWNDPSKELISNVFTGDFFKKGSKDFVLCNVDIVQDETLMDKTLIETNYAAASSYGVQELPYFILQTAEGDVYASSGTGKEAATIDGFLAFLASFEEARDKLVNLKNNIKNSKGAEKAVNIDLFIEAVDPSRRESYAALIREIPALDADGKAGLKGKYQLQVAYLDAVALYQAQKMTEAGEIFLELAQGGSLNGAQMQEAWYMGAYMYAMSGTVDNGKVIELLEKAISADPDNVGTTQIKATIEQIKTAPTLPAASN